MGLPGVLRRHADWEHHTISIADDVSSLGAQTTRCRIKHVRRFEVFRTLPVEFGGDAPGLARRPPIRIPSVRHFDFNAGIEALPPVANGAAGEQPSLVVKTLVPVG